jgi:hypothetical protein
VGWLLWVMRHWPEAVDGHYDPVLGHDVDVLAEDAARSIAPRSFEPPKVAVVRSGGCPRRFLHPTFRHDASPIGRHAPTEREQPEACAAASEESAETATIRAHKLRKDMSGARGFAQKIEYSSADLCDLCV